MGRLDGRERRRLWARVSDQWAIASLPIHVLMMMEAILITLAHVFFCFCDASPLSRLCVSRRFHRDANVVTARSGSSTRPMM